MNTIPDVHAADPDGSDAKEGSRRRVVVAAVLAVLVVQFLVLGLVQAWQDSFTFDEPFYAVSGSTAIREGDLRINYEHPPLPKVLAAIPAELFGDVDIPLDTGAWDRGDTWNLSLQMVQANQDDLQMATFLYRIVPLLEAAAIGILLFLLGRELFSWKAGLLSAVLWLTLPVALGFGHLNGLDVPAALTVVLSLWLLARYVRSPTLVRLGLVGVSVGLALLSRAAVGLVVAVAAFGVVAVWDLAHRNWFGPLRALGVLVMGWAIVWIGYLALDPSGLDVTIFDPGTQALLAESPSSLPGRIALLVPWPAGFEAGIRFLSNFHSSAESPGYLFGVNFEGAPPWFWVGSFVFKLTTVALLTMVAGVIAFFWLPWRVAARATLVLLPMLLGLMIMMAFAQRPFGFRYLIPILVIALAVAGAVAVVLPGRVALIGLGLVVSIQLIMVWESHPGSLAWSNPLLRDSWQLAADANVDWGQDFYRLQDWAADKDEPLYVSYFGFGPSFALDEIPNAISAHPDGLFSGRVRFPPTSPKYVVISASNLNAFAAGQFGALRHWCPVEKIGETILVYHFEQIPRNMLGRPGGVPVALCPEQEFSIEMRE